MLVPRSVDGTVIHTPGTLWADSAHHDDARGAGREGPDRGRHRGREPDAAVGGLVVRAEQVVRVDLPPVRLVRRDLVEPDTARREPDEVVQVQTRPVGVLPDPGGAAALHAADVAPGLQVPRVVDDAALPHHLAPGID